MRTLGPAKSFPNAPPVFTADSRTIVTTVGGWVQVWEVATGGEIAFRSGHRESIYELILSADGRRLATVASDNTRVVWDLAQLVTADAPQAIALETWWDELANRDAVRGRQAIEALIVAGGQTVPLFQKCLRPVPMPNVKQLDHWIADLGGDDFELRQQAEQALDRLGEGAGAALRQALAGYPPLEARRRIDGLLKKLDPIVVTTEQLREGRALQVLEGLGSPDALRLLRELSRGAAGARLTEDAAAAIERLERHAK